MIPREPTGDVMTPEHAVEIVELCAACDWDINDRTRLPDAHRAIDEWLREQGVLAIREAVGMIGKLAAVRAYMSWWLGAMRAADEGVGPGGRS